MIMKGLKFKDEDIWLDGDLIGGYSWKDENSDFRPTKKKLFWAAIYEHENQSDDFVWWAENVPALKARVAKYLENKEKGIKDLPQISEQIKRITYGVHNYAMEHFKNETMGYYSQKSLQYIHTQLKRLDFPRKIKERGYWMYDEKLIPLDIYKLF